MIPVDIVMTDRDDTRHLEIHMEVVAIPPVGGTWFTDIESECRVTEVAYFPDRVFMRITTNWNLKHQDIVDEFIREGWSPFIF